MFLQQIRCDAIEEFFAEQSDWDFEYLQLSPGALDFRSSVITLPGVQIYWNVFGRPMKLLETYRGSKLIFGFILDPARGTTYHGHEFHLDFAIVKHPNVEHDYVVGEGLTSLEIYVDNKLIDQMGWFVDRTSVRVVPRVSLRALAAECRRVTGWMAVSQPSGMDGGEALLMQDRILVRLEECLAPWLGVPGASGRPQCPGTRDFRLVKGSELLFEQNDLSYTASDALAKELGVSRRTLYYAYRKLLGMGPRAYLELLRLHRLRNHLLRGNETDVSVTEEAYKMGFSHLGRMSAAYRRLFGELPRDTLRRC